MSKKCQMANIHETLPLLLKFIGEKDSENFLSRL